MDRDAFERLYAEHAQRMFAYLAYQTGDRALAEDLLADAFERALRARSRFDRRKAKETTWIYAIARNCLRDHVRRQAAEARAVARVEAGMPPGDESFEARVEARGSLAAAFALLSEEEREAVALRYGADLTVPELAKILGLRESTVQGRVYRGLAKLRGELER